MSWDSSTRKVMDNFRFLNPDDFKRWMRKHDESEDEVGLGMVGSSVEAKHCGKRTARCITLESGKVGRVVREFVQSGGVVKSADGEELLVEVESGSFYINKRNVIF
jgi:hypothetical protein